MVVLGGGRGSYERGTPVHEVQWLFWARAQEPRRASPEPRFRRRKTPIQGYLAHKKTPSSLGPPGNPPQRKSCNRQASEQDLPRRGSSDSEGQPMASPQQAVSLQVAENSERRRGSIRPRHRSKIWRTQGSQSLLTGIHPKMLTLAPRATALLKRGARRPLPPRSNTVLVKRVY